MTTLLLSLLFLALGAGGYLSLFVLPSAIIPSLIVGIPALLCFKFLLDEPNALPRLWHANLAFATALVAASALIHQTAGLVVLSALKIVLLPILYWMLGYLIVERVSAKTVARIAVPLIVANLLMAAWQWSVGYEELINFGYVYQETVRTFDESVRAFGLMPRDNIFGQAAGVLALASIVGWRLSSVSRMQLVVSLVSSVACLILSTNRASLAALGIALVVVAPAFGRTIGRRIRTGLILAVIPLVVYFAWVGQLGSFDSVRERTQVWVEALMRTNAFIGEGAGEAGVTAGTRLAGSGDIASVGDNYFVTIFVQFGVLGLLFVGLHYALLMSGHKPSSVVGRSALAFVSYALVVSLFDNFYEEVPSYLLLCFTAGILVKLGRQHAHFRERPLPESTDDGCAAIR